MLLSSFCGYSQQKYHQFEIKTNYGITAPFHEYMNHLVRSNIFIGEIIYSIKTNGTKPWHNAWRCPEPAIGYLRGTIGDSKILGFSNSLFILWGVPIIEKENFLFKYRIGTGLAYITKCFSPEIPYNYNIMVGSKFNAHLHVSFLCDYKLFDTPLYLTTGFSFNHFSCGRIKRPNDGVNQFTYSLGLKYLYSKTPYKLNREEYPSEVPRKFEISPYYAASLAQNRDFEEKTFFINSFLIDFAYRVNYRRSWGIGHSFAHDQSLMDRLPTELQTKSSLYRLGIHAYHEIYFIDYLSMVLQVGTYYYNKYDIYGLVDLIYIKMGIRYSYKNLFTNIILKTHSFAADYIEFGIGYRFVVN